VVNAKPAEQDYFTDTNLSELFGAHPNTIANWRRGRTSPPGFLEAFARRDRKAMAACAGPYRANRDKADIMNRKTRVHRDPDEFS
jgi:hypothetical protein